MTIMLMTAIIGTNTGTGSIASISTGRKATGMTTKESGIVRKITKYLRDRGWLVEKLHGSIYQRAGLPDLFALKDGKIAFFEVKRPKGKVSAIQEYTLKELKEHGAIVGVVHSVEEVDCILTNGGENALRVQRYSK